MTQRDFLDLESRPNQGEEPGPQRGRAPHLLAQELHLRQNVSRRAFWVAGPLGGNLMVSFRTTLAASTGNNVGIVVPEDIVLGFGRGKRVPVTVTIDGDYSYRNTIASMGGQFLISFNAETRAATGRGAGDEVEVTLEVDDAPRIVDVPEALAAAFVANPGAAEAWAELSYSKQRAHAEPIVAAKTEETRARRVQKVIDSLSS